MNKKYEYKDLVFVEDLKEYENRDMERFEQPVGHIISGGVILPFLPESTDSVKGRGGVLDQSLTYVPESATEIEGIMPCGYEVDPNSIKYVDQRVVYLGYFLPQWGHFLVDFLPRLWWLMENDRTTTLVYLSANSMISGNYLRVLELMGVSKERLFRIETPTKYSTVVVPEMSLKRPQYYTEEYRKLISKIVSAVPEQKVYSKIYWTRTKFERAQQCEIGEKRIEKLFAQNGYTVLAPEKCTVEEQIFWFSHCSEFAALSGTIPHNIVWMATSQPEKKRRVIILNKTHRINTIQCLLNSFARIEAIYVDCNYSLFPVSPGGGPFWVGINDNLRKFAEDEKFTVDKESKFSRKLRIRREYIKYCLMYVKMVRRSDIDLDGCILSSSRPFSEGKEKKITYFMYRDKLGDFPTFASAWDVMVKIARKIKRKLL